MCENNDHPPRRGLEGQKYEEINIDIFLIKLIYLIGKKQHFGHFLDFFGWNVEPPVKPVIVLKIIHHAMRSQVEISWRLGVGKKELAAFGETQKNMSRLNGRTRNDITETKGQTSRKAGCEQALGCFTGDGASEITNFSKSFT